MKPICAFVTTARWVSLFVIAGGFCAAAGGQVFDLTWNTIEGGGELFASGGSLELSGTVGQADAAPTVITGGTLELVGGFWAIQLTQQRAGDTDGDGDVDLADLSRLLSNFGTLSGATRSDGDFDGDGDVDLSDLSALLGHFGT